MKFVWPALLGFFRTIYLTYSVWCLLFPIALLAWCVSPWIIDTNHHPQWILWFQAGLGVFALLVLYVIWHAYRHRNNGDPNPWQSGFLAWFGSLKLFQNAGDAAAVPLHWPSSYLVENPRGYRISGPNMRTILGLLQPGDILLRAYEGYVDGEFIRRSSLTSQNGFKPGWFTHVALYAGELTESDRVHVPEPFRNQPDYFSSGPQMVIHSMAKGVHTEDILTFLRCDYLTVLRLEAELTLKPGSETYTQASKKQGRPTSLSDKLHTAIAKTLQAGEAVPRNLVIQAARLSALEKIGEAYDFDCSDTQKFNRFSCAELLYYCLRGVLGALELKPMPHALYPFAPRFKRFHVLKRVTITPDDYDGLADCGHFIRLWEDEASKKVKSAQHSFP
jgi:hypothetical protein